MNKAVILWFGLWSCLQAGSVLAGEGRVRLDHFFDTTRSFSGTFTQQVMDERFTVTQSSSGELLVQRPDRFRWDYLKPYRQLIVSDGRRIWLYDRDLEQVTIKPVDETLGSSPAMLLSGREPLEKNFAIHERGPIQELEWLDLVARDPESSFDRIRLAFNARSQLQVMELVDKFGQTTRLEFGNLVINPGTKESDFQFVPPPGVDVIGGKETAAPAAER